MYVAKVNATKILLLNTEFIVPVITNMDGLLKYFFRESELKLPVLPDLEGSLSEKVPSSSVDLTNNIIHDILDKKTTLCEKCGEYLSLTSAQKFLIGKCTAEDGVTATNKNY